MEEIEVNPEDKAYQLITEIMCVEVMPIVKAKRLAQIQVVNIVNELTRWGAPYLFEDSKDNDWANNRLYNYWVDVSLNIENYETNQ